MRQHGLVVGESGAATQQLTVTNASHVLRLLWSHHVLHPNRDRASRVHLQKQCAHHQRPVRLLCVVLPPQGKTPPTSVSVILAQCMSETLSWRRSGATRSRKGTTCHAQTCWTLPGLGSRPTLRTPKLARMPRSARGGSTNTSAVRQTVQRTSARAQGVEETRMMLTTSPSYSKNNMSRDHTGHGALKAPQRTAQKGYCAKRATRGV